jgi:hypothetical protein
MRPDAGLEARLGLGIRVTPGGLLPGGAMGLLAMAPRRGSRSVVVPRRANYQLSRNDLLWVYLWVLACLPVGTSGTIPTGAVLPVAPPIPWMVVPLGPFERLSQRADDSQLRGALRICVKDRYAGLHDSFGHCLLGCCPMHGHGMAGLASPHADEVHRSPGDGGLESPTTSQIEEKSLYQRKRLRLVAGPTTSPTSDEWDGMLALGVEHVLQI